MFVRRVVPINLIWQRSSALTSKWPNSISQPFYAAALPQRNLFTKTKNTSFLKTPSQVKESENVGDLATAMKINDQMDTNGASEKTVCQNFDRILKIIAIIKRHNEDMKSKFDGKRNVATAEQKAKQQVQHIINLQFKVLVDNVEALKSMEDVEVLSDSTMDKMLETIQRALLWSSYSQGFRIIPTKTVQKHLTDMLASGKILLTPEQVWRTQGLAYIFSHGANYWENSELTAEEITALRLVIQNAVAAPKEVRRKFSVKFLIKQITSLTSLPRNMVDELVSGEFVQENAREILAASAQIGEKQHDIDFERSAKVYFTGLDKLEKLGHTFTESELAQIQVLQQAVLQRSIDPVNVAQALLLGDISPDNELFVKALHRVHSSKKFTGVKSQDFMHMIQPVLSSTDPNILKIVPERVLADLTRKTDFRGSMLKLEFLVGKTYGEQLADQIKAFTTLWELGYSSFRFDQAVQALTQRLINTALKSRAESMKSTIYIGEIVSAMLKASADNARQTLDEKFVFEEGRDSDNKGGETLKSKPSIFIGLDYLLQQELAKQLEYQFYCNICDATASDYLNIAMILCTMVKGGSPQFWRLISRELVKAKNNGELDEADLRKLVQMRLQSRSQKFFLTVECMEALGIATSIEELETIMQDNYQVKYRQA